MVLLLVLYAKPPLKRVIKEDIIIKGQRSPMFQLPAMMQGTLSAGNADPSAVFCGQLAAFSVLQPRSQRCGFHLDARHTLTTGMLCNEVAFLRIPTPPAISVSNTLIKTDLRTAVLSQTSSLAVACSSAEGKV